MRLIFMGSPDFGVPALHALLQAGHDIVAAYTQPPRPAGRGKKLQRQPVHEAMDALGIPVRTPAKLRHNKEEQSVFESLQADVAIVAAYGLILPPEILNAPKHGCLNIHASLLPRWRGASPIQSAIRAGDEETGICIMQMDEELDTGAILLRGTTSITAEDTASTLHDRLATLGARLVVEALRDMPNPIPQTGKGMCYAPRLTRDDGKIDWSRSALEIERQIRAFTPWPGNSTTLNGATYRIGMVSLLEGTSTEPPGTVLDDKLSIACGQGMLRIEKIQKPGRAMINSDTFLRGHTLAKGERFV